MKKKKLSIYCLIIVLGLFSLAVSGCKATTVTTSETTTTENTILTYTPTNNTNGEKYSSFIATGIPRFSLEYPDEYEVMSYQPMPEYPSTSLMFRTVKPTTNSTKTYSKFNSINISVVYLNSYFPSAEAAVDKTASQWGAGNVEDFNVIYKRQVMVGGIQGWEIKLSLTTFPQGFGIVAYDVPIHIIVREVYFDYQGMSFNIALISGANIINETDKAYEYVLGTFKLLE